MERPDKLGPVMTAAAVLVVFAVAVLFGVVVRLLFVATERSPITQVVIGLSVLALLVYLVWAARRARRIGRGNLSPSARLMENLIRAQKAAAGKPGPKPKAASASAPEESAPSPSESPDPPSPPPAP